MRSLDAQLIRSLLLSRQQLLQSRRAIENQIRGALKTLGAMTGPTKGRSFMPRVQSSGATKIGLLLSWILCSEPMPQLPSS